MLNWLIRFSVSSFFMGCKGPAIQEVKDVDALPIEQLIGSLMTHELSMQQKALENKKGKKIVILKSITNNEESDEEDEDDEATLISRKF